MNERKPRTHARDDVAGLIDIAEQTRDLLLRSTVPIYQGEKRGTPQVAGSGILVTLGTMRFLLTAGHVLDLRTQGPLLVGLPSALAPLSGDSTRLRTPGSGGSSGDSIDIGIIRLVDGWQSIPGEHFLDWERLDTKIPIVARHSYALVGFPNSMNRSPIDGDRLGAFAISTGGLECASVAYEETHIDPVLNVMVGIEKSVWTRDGQRNSPDLYGSSGGGLWRYGRFIRTSTGPPRLSAIAIEWHRKGRHRYVLGTRITFILGAIADKYPEVKAFIDQHQPL
jgi:hypothetical protein